MRIVISFFLLLASVTSLADETPRRANIDPDVWFVASGGLWKKSDTEYGNFRVIVRNEGWEHTRSSLYLQWLKSDDQKQRIVVLKEMPVSEFNSGGWFNVLHIERRDSTFLISYLARGEDTNKNAELRPGLPGVYRFVVRK